MEAVGKVGLAIHLDKHFEQAQRGMIGEVDDPLVAPLCMPTAVCELAALAAQVGMVADPVEDQAKPSTETSTTL